LNNAEIANALAEVADVLELQGADSFRIRAYRNAVRTVEVQTRPLAQIVEEGGQLTALPAIGKEMAGHIREMLTTGTLALRDRLLAETPRTLVEIMRLPGVGAGKARRLWDELGIATLDELEAAARAGRVAALAGFGEKSQAKILAGIADHRENSIRFLLAEAERSLVPLTAWLGECAHLLRLEPAGSYRRRSETVGNIDLLAGAADPAPVMERFLAYPQIGAVLTAGETRSSIALGNGLQVDLVVVPPDGFGAALLDLTGGQEHIAKLRRRGVERGLRISERGVFRQSRQPRQPRQSSRPPGSAAAAGPGAEVRIAGAEEAEVYAALGLAWIPPELREDHGEIELASGGEGTGQLPQLIEAADLRGDLHMHSTWSDGRDTLEEMVAACAARGYEYMAISDHSKALAMVNGLDARRLRLQWAEIGAIRARHPEIQVLRAMEIDILADGSLDLEDEMIAGLDLAVVSVHSRFELPQEEQTARVLRALDHPRVDILGHPTGRRIQRRKPLALDMEAVLRRAALRGVAVEVNAQPHRLDLKDTHLRLARELGCRIVISSDAHRAADLGNLRFGVDQARRAGLEPGHVLNARPYAEFARLLRDRKAHL
jgi:DNA polymerase (family X)